MAAVAAAEEARAPAAAASEGETQMVDPAAVEDNDGRSSSSGSSGGGRLDSAEHGGQGEDNGDGSSGWSRSSLVKKSLESAHATVPFPDASAPWWRKLMSFAGSGLVIGVAYTDPGNWATDVAGGAGFGYDLLCVVLFASLIGMLVQYLSLKLGIATNRDLAMACHDALPHKVNVMLWLVMEMAIAATDLAEILGAAIALNLLTGLPIPAGVAVTGVDVFFILLLQNERIRLLEGLVSVLMLAIFVCLLYVTVLAQPDAAAVFWGFIPSGSVVTNPDELFTAIGIIGATVMPHSLFLHSALAQTRNYPRTVEGRRAAVKFAAIDSTLSLIFAFVINALILILAGAAFHAQYSGTSDLGTAYQLLAPAVGSQAASTLFAFSLLCSGQQASLIGTLAGQIVMEGMVEIRVRPWVRRLLTRLVAMIPAIIVTTIFAQSASALLIISQVFLSISLSFILPPLVYFTSDVRKMGPAHVNSRALTVVSVTVTLLLTALNIYVMTNPSTWQL